jgi:hypothetical protein
MLWFDGHSLDVPRLKKFASKLYHPYHFIQEKMSRSCIIGGLIEKIAMLCKC